VFVATSGADSNPCTQASPCLSFNRAYHLAQPGQTVEVAAGSYGDQTLSSDSTKSASGSRVVFQPASGASVVVGSKPLSTTTQTSAGLDVIGSTAVSFRDFTIRGDVIVEGGANGVTLQNLVTSNGNFGVYHASSVSFSGGSYGGTNRYKSEIYPDGAWQHNANITVTGVTIHDVRSDDLGNYHVEGLLVSDGNGVTLRGNTFYNNDVFDLSIGVFGSATLSNLTVENNFFASAAGPKFDSSLGLNTNTTSWNGLNVRNNSSLTYMRHPVCSGGCTNVRYSGNIAPLVGVSQCVSGVTYRDNVWVGGGAVCNSSDKAVGSAGFVNPGAHDLHLTTGSPAIDAGDPGDYPANDLDGQARPMGGAPDAGADEKQ
jgi:hypothetical protein